MIFSCHSYFSDFIMLYCILKMQKIRNSNFTEKRWYNKNAERKVDEKWTTISLNGGAGISRTKR